MRKTWDIILGAPYTCCDESGTTINIGSIGIDFTPVINKLDEIIVQNNTTNITLSDILSEIQDINSPLTQTMFQTTIAGSIPAGVQSYSIFNLGLVPADPNTTYNDMIVGGISLSTKNIAFGNSTDSTKVLDNAVSYNPNGNTLLIVYNS